MAYSRGLPCGWGPRNSAFGLESVGCRKGRTRTRSDVGRKASLQRVSENGRAGRQGGRAFVSQIDQIGYDSPRRPRKKSPSQLEKFFIQAKYLSLSDFRVQLKEASNYFSILQPFTIKRLRQIISH